MDTVVGVHGFVYPTDAQSHERLPLCHVALLWPLPGQPSLGEQAGGRVEDHQRA